MVRKVRLWERVCPSQDLNKLRNIRDALFFSRSAHSLASWIASATSANVVTA